MTRTYQLAKGAAADLADIIRHTQQQWGEAQCLAYVKQIEDTACALSRGEGLFKDLSFLHPMLRMAKSGHHFIFCLPRPHAPALILAILHERMDMMARLKNRLG